MTSCAGADGSRFNTTRLYCGPSRAKDLLRRLLWFGFERSFRASGFAMGSTDRHLVLKRRICGGRPSARRTITRMAAAVWEDNSRRTSIRPENGRMDKVGAHDG